MMTTVQEREVLKEFIEVYRENPCLWDMNSDLYRNKDLKHEAWGQMTQILKKMDPDANICTTKKKVENLRAAFFRELKKVRASELRATDASDIFVPNLWYYKMISFLDSKEWRPSRVPDPLQCDIKQAPTSDEESMESSDLLVFQTEIDPEIPPKRKSTSSQGSAKKVKRLEPTIQTIIEPLIEPKYLEQKKNYFGTYVGEQLEQVSTFQRHVAERLISEVLFLAKTGNLSYESRIESKVCQNEQKKEEKVDEKRPTTLLKELLSEGRQK